MRFLFIQAHARIFHITTMCRVLQVSKAGYYAWRARPLAARVQDDRRLRARIRVIYEEAKGRYGSPRIYQELRALGLACGKHRTARLMRVEGLRAKSARRFRVTTQSDHAHPTVPNVLARDFAVPEPIPATAAAAPVWMADITYVPTGQGWLYLAVILERASRRVVGWALRPHLGQELARSALAMALQHHRPRGGIHHSDRGVQYASHAYRQQLEHAGFTLSMSRRGNCWDNAVVESFFATLTKELLVDGMFLTREAARQAVFEFIEVWYNRRRRHSALGYRTPAEYAEVLLKAS
ncbi:MAG TPA: IS3 family transposase [Gemmatimonadaceae bacterium]|nr:IS3 family transposase [Gemmatimonadaceae bacterium]